MYKVLKLTTVKKMKNISIPSVADSRKFLSSLSERIFYKLEPTAPAQQEIKPKTFDELQQYDYLRVETADGLKICRKDVDHEKNMVYVDVSDLTNQRTIEANQDNFAGQASMVEAQKVRCEAFHKQHPPAPSVPSGE